MDRLLEMQIFKKVAEAKSFRSAAEHFKLSPASVTVAVRSLEERLGARLLHRTTRRTTLTEVGAAFLERCTRVLDDLAEAEAVAGMAQTAPRGVLRIGMPLGFGVTHLAGVVVRFAEHHPGLRLDIEASDRFLDPVEHGYDVVIRVARALRDSSLVAVRLASAPIQLVASPSYLARHGTPRRPQDLRAHRALIYSRSTTPEQWTFRRGGRSHSVHVAGAFRADNSLILRRAALGGLGVAMIPRFYVADDLGAGTLRGLLDAYRPAPASVLALYPSGRAAPAKVRVFLDFMRSELARDAASGILPA
jgi:DNA-binding transcriptional LysR family regulator